MALGRTNVPGIYAIGDVAGPPMLAHKAEHEGVICVEAIEGLHPHPLDKRMIPGCTYCNPQIASVGLTEARAKDGGHRAQGRPLPLHRQWQGDRARRAPRPGQDDLRRQDRAALGAHMVGAEVTELIQGFVVAMNCETTEEELMHTVFPHPTLSEMMHEACSTPMAAF